MRNMSLPTYEFTLRDVIQQKKVTQDEVTEIRLWMPTANLPEVSDEVLVSFIIACKWDLEKTRSAIRAYFEIKASAPGLFDDRDIDRDELKQATSVIQLAIMPIRTNDDCNVHFFTLKDRKYTNFHIDPITNLLFMLVDISLNAKSPPRGIKIIIDVKGAGLLHLTRLKFKTMRKILAFLQEGMPLNTTEIHVLNSILLVDKVLFMVKPFMNPELFNILTLHPGNTNMEEFSKKHIPKKCLPQEYGGDLPPMEELHQKTIEQFRDLKEFFDSEQTLRNQWSKKNYTQ